MEKQNNRHLIFVNLSHEHELNMLREKFCKIVNMV